MTKSGRSEEKIEAEERMSAIMADQSDLSALREKSLDRMTGVEVLLQRRNYGSSL